MVNGDIRSWTTTDVVLGLGGLRMWGSGFQGFRMWRLGLILPPIINSSIIYIYIICVYNTRIHL